MVVIWAHLGIVLESFEPIWGQRNGCNMFYLCQPIPGSPLFRSHWDSRFFFGCNIVSMALLRRLSSESTVTSWAPLTPPPQTNTPPVAPAETAPQRPETRGLPMGKTIPFDIDHGVELLADLARNRLAWLNWDGTTYPKTKGPQGPSQEALVVHAPVLLHLLTLAPNGYPCPYGLRDLLCQLHMKFNIFGDDYFMDCQPLIKRAMLAADRWRIMCKHCSMLKHSGATIRFPDLTAVVSLIHPVLPEPEAVLPEPAATAFEAMDVDDVEDDVAPTKKARTSRPVVPSNGVIDGGHLEDKLPEPEIESTWDGEISEPDLSKPQASKLKRPHDIDDTECVITAIRCACCIGQPALKKCRGSPAETAIPPAPAGKVDETEDTARPEPTAIHPNIAANKSAEEPVLFPPNHLSELEKLADLAMANWGSCRNNVEEKNTSMRLEEKGRKVASLAATAATKELEGECKSENIPVEGKHGGLQKRRRHLRARIRHPYTKDKPIGPPFFFEFRRNPISKAGCTLNGTIDGKRYKFITKVSVNMHQDFSTIMQQLHKEAIAGTLATKYQAVHRRDQLIRNQPAVTGKQPV